MPNIYLYLEERCIKNILRLLKNKKGIKIFVKYNHITILDKLAESEWNALHNERYCKYSNIVYVVYIVCLVYIVYLVI